MNNYIFVKDLQPGKIYKFSPNNNYYFVVSVVHKIWSGQKKTIHVKYLNQNKIIECVYFEHEKTSMDLVLVE